MKGALKFGVVGDVVQNELPALRKLLTVDFPSSYFRRAVANAHNRFHDICHELCEDTVDDFLDAETTACIDALGYLTEAVRSPALAKVHLQKAIDVLNKIDYPWVRE